MPPEHAEMEADWLASQLKTASEYARKAYTHHKDQECQLYLANLIGTLDSLSSHFAIPETVEGEEETQNYPYAPPTRRKRRGPIARFFLGDN